MCLGTRGTKYACFAVRKAIELTSVGRSMQCLRNFVRGGLLVRMLLLHQMNILIRLLCPQNELKYVLAYESNNVFHFTKQEATQLLQLFPKGAPNTECKVNVVEAFDAMACITFTSMYRLSTSQHWTVDSGVTNHLTCYRYWLTDV